MSSNFIGSSLIAIILIIEGTFIGAMVQESNKIAAIRADTEITTLGLLQDIVYPVQEYCYDAR